MNLNSKTVWTRVVFTFLVTGMLGLGLTSLGFAANPEEEKPAVSQSQDNTKVQESLRDKGYYHADVDGVLGPQTREAIRQYQKSENLPVTGRLDGETAGKLGVGPESVGGSFESAGHEVGRGGKELGHEMKKGKGDCQRGGGMELAELSGCTRRTCSNHEAARRGIPPRAIARTLPQDAEVEVLTHEDA